MMKSFLPEEYITVSSLAILQVQKWDLHVLSLTRYKSLIAEGSVRFLWVGFPISKTWFAHLGYRHQAVA